MDEYDQFCCPKCGWNGIIDNLKSGFTFPNFCPNCGTNELNENFSGGENYRKPNQSIAEYLARQPWIEIKISNKPDPAVIDNTSYPRSFALLIEVESNYVKEERDGIVSQTKTSKYVRKNLSNDELLDLIKLLYSISE